MVQETKARLAERVAKHVARRGRVCLRVRGASMLPWVRSGDLVVARGIQPEALRCGDLALFARQGQLYVHRVIEKRDLAWGPRLLAKGDAQPQPDGVIQRDELLGRVVRIQRGKRRMDLDAPWQLLKGILIARISAHSRRWYPAAKFAAIAALSVRRLLAFFL